MNKTHEDLYQGVLGYANHEAELLPLLWYLGFWFFGPENSTIIEVEHYYSHFITWILLLQEKCIEANLLNLMHSFGYCLKLSNNFHIFGDNISFVKQKEIVIFFHFFIPIYIPISFHCSSKERASPVYFVFFHYLLYINLILFELFKKKNMISEEKKV